MSKYTVVSFAPVQDFIEKSRKLRDLYGASQILSYLSWKIVTKANGMEGVRVISPAGTDSNDTANMDIVQGMPNRILLEGIFSDNDARSALAKGWDEIVTACREWIEEQLAEDFTFSDESWGRAWTKWKINAWEIFWGTGETIKEAMRNLETRKLRRDWTAPNWNGESSSLSGTDAIAYPKMDNLVADETEIKKFYKRLSEVLDPSGKENDRAYINENERLSIPELIKRLVTYSEVTDAIDYYRVIRRDDSKAFELESFSKLLRQNKDKNETYWTGWFMGDGDRIGNYLNELPNDGESVKKFSSCLRSWGKDFKGSFELGRVVYAGGDDFLGAIYGTEANPQRDKQEVVNWLCGLRDQWERVRDDMRQKELRVNDGNEPDVTLSVGFVWAGHSVPQRDVLQHCREAEKRAKSLGRDRVTIRVLFNNGQFVQWTTPWKYLKWLSEYSDRNNKTGKDANWSHIYSDLAQLKARHAIPPKTAQNPDDAIALTLFGLYFGEDKKEELSEYRGEITGTKYTKVIEDKRSVIEWIEGLIQVGWQLCSNS
jgi:CRISPR-associated protein Cmr2